jgi:hypothetical protein
MKSREAMQHNDPSERGLQVVATTRAAATALPLGGAATFATDLTAQSDEGQQHDGGADLAVLLCRHCDSDPIGPLAGSSIPANSGGVSWPLSLRRFCKRRAAAAWDEKHERDDTPAARRLA